METMDPIEDLVERVGSLTVEQATRFRAAMRERFQIKDYDGNVIANVEPNPIVANIIQEEFDLILESPGDKKIECLKTVREITGLGLKECKDLVDLVPSVLKKNVQIEPAYAFKTRLEATGATVTLK